MASNVSRPMYEATSKRYKELRPVQRVSSHFAQSQFAQSRVRVRVRNRVRVMIKVNDRVRVRKWDWANWVWAKWVRTVQRSQSR